MTNVSDGIVEKQYCVYNIDREEIAMAKKKAKIVEPVLITDEEVRKVIPIAKKIIARNSLANAFEEDISEMTWYANAELTNVELAMLGENDKENFPVCIGPNRWFDSNCLMLMQDHSSNWVQYEVAKRIVEWLPNRQHWKVVGEKDEQEGNKE